MEANTKQSVKAQLYAAPCGPGLGRGLWAQSEGLNYVETFTFNTCRFILGGAVLIPCIYFPARQKGQCMADLA